MPARTRYPWSTLAIGESVTVFGVPSRRTVYTSLGHFRNEVCIRDLGFRRDHVPRFEFAWEKEPAGTLAVTITRVTDGQPAWGPGTAGKSRTALSMTPDQIEWQSIMCAHDLHLHRRAQAVERDEAKPMTPLDLINRAMAYDKRNGTRLAAMMAEFDNPPSLDDLGEHKPMNRHPLRRHDDQPDRACSTTLAEKLKGACSTSVS